MSHGDGNSTEGEGESTNPAQTGPGCFKNYEHNVPNHHHRHRRSNSSQNPRLPTGDGPPPPPPLSPVSAQQRLLDVAQPEEQQLLTAALAPLAQDETQCLVQTPRGYISPGVRLDRLR